MSTQLEFHPVDMGSLSSEDLERVREQAKAMPSAQLDDLVAYVREEWDKGRWRWDPYR